MAGIVPAVGAWLVSASMGMSRMGLYHTKRGKWKENMNATDSKAWKRALHKAQLCTECKSQDAYTLAGHWLCAECSEKKAERMRAKRRDSDYGHIIWERRKAQQWERREQGLCYKCGRERTDKRYKLCGRCRAKWREYRLKTSTAKTRQQLRGKDGRCWTCNDALCEPGFKTCPACHAKLKAQVAINSRKRPEKHPWRDADKLIFHVRKP